MDSNTQNIIKMPDSIAKAVNEVSSHIQKLEKSNDNKFDRYKFTSIDDFMENVQPLCANAGLIIIQDEASKPDLIEKAGKSGNVLMLWCEFNFTLVSKTGDTYGPIRRSVMVQATGAQAFGSAQSYALKQFLRSLFMIPTGDKDDPDNDATKDIANPPTIDVQKIAKSINSQIARAKTKAQLDHVSVEYNQDLALIKTTSQTAYDFLMDAINKRATQLNPHIDTNRAEYEMDEEYKNTVGK